MTEPATESSPEIKKHTPPGSYDHWIAAFAGAVVLEVLTCFLRFGARLESTRDTASTIGVLTMGLRIHHGYIGIAVLIFAWVLSRSPWPAVSERVIRWLFIAGMALFASDMIHHFLVLWPITGSPQFHLWYPAAS